MSEPLSRRSALRGLAISGCAAVVGFVLARANRPGVSRGASTAANGYGPGPSGGQKLAAVADVPPAGGVVLKDRKIVLTRGADDAVNGFSAICTHQGCLVDAVSDGAIACPCHGSSFDAQTGKVISGPANRPLPKVAVVVRDNDVYPA